MVLALQLHKPGMLVSGTLCFKDSIGRTLQMHIQYSAENGYKNDNLATFIHSGKT